MHYISIMQVLKVYKTLPNMRNVHRLQLHILKKQSQCQKQCLRKSAPHTEMLLSRELRSIRVHTNFTKLFVAFYHRHLHQV